MRPSEINSGVAAFFDLDGTLIPGPSLERRLFKDLRYRRAIPIGNYFLWLARAARLATEGIQMMRHANKMYLRGVRRDGSESAYVGAKKGAVPRFFPAAIDQVVWHAKQGHGIVLVSGTLAPLANEMAVALIVRLAVRGIEASVGVCATRLEENDGRWTGRIIGDAVCGEAKARAIRRIATEREFDLSQCYAYGDCANDRWMLEVVGRPAAVNPSRGMARLARRRGWPVLTWVEGRNRAERSEGMQGDEAEKVA
ncbi:MAG: putative Haloacid dehalogenase superfamily hydrolase, subfamily PSPase-like [Candidatus Acidoferrum typicum]|nr:putative Haloacid dehalogenase superfamily hydrolase, subfamily PSPase-like [Candidatus Acidoferrum typicum]